MTTLTRLTRRLALALAALVLGTSVLLLAPGAASAAGRESSSPVLAATAAAALQAHDTWASTGDPTAYVDYLQLRDEAATIAGTELGLDAVAMRAAWAAAEPMKQRALLAAITQLGVPYRSMAMRPGEGFDCSGLTSFAWSRAGLQLSRPSGSQIREATKVPREEAQAGDFVYYPGHISMYLGVDDAIVHSSNTGDDVEITFLSGRKSVTFGDPTG